MTSPGSNSPGHSMMVRLLYYFYTVQCCILLFYLSVVHTVGCQDMKQVFLFDVISFSEHIVIPVCSVYIKIYLSDLFTKVSSTLSKM